MKKFEIGNKKYIFDSIKFIEYFRNYRKENKIKVDELEQLLAKELSVEQCTVHNWRFGPSGPNNLDLIKDLAKYLGLNNYMHLLKEEKTMIKLTDLQLQSVKRVYDAFIEFLHEFDMTGGFTTTMWNDLCRRGSKDPEEDLYEYVENLEAKIQLEILKEYFYLHDLPIYNEFINYLYEDLFEIYDGKLGYAYRIEAIPEGNPTTEEDYTKALDKLNSIIEKYN